MSHWTTANMPDQAGKLAIVTGANSGLGLEASRALAEKGARVIMACRNTDKGQAAADQVRQQHPNADLDVQPLDLADLASVRAFAEAFAARGKVLPLLINNAGVMALPQRRETADGFEMQFGTNHLGHFALTGLLLPHILAAPGARVVTVSSGAHTMGRLDFDDLQAEKSYGQWRAYGNSKLANLLFTYELQRRFESWQADAIAVAAHPGYTATNLQQHSGLFSFLNHIMAQGVEKGTLPLLYAATAPEVKGGEYYGPDGFMEWRGYPQRVTSKKRSHDTAAAARLWDVSEELTGVVYDRVREAVPA
jgi:NAD(P)-dependent dehydrogenase (short-subunit alcohol dehydrogenase family)